MGSRRMKRSVLLMILSVLCGPLRESDLARSTHVSELHARAASMAKVWNSAVEEKFKKREELY